jgi:hypothetical protein
MKIKSGRLACRSLQFAAAKFRAKLSRVNSTSNARATRQIARVSRAKFPDALDRFLHECLDRAAARFVLVCYFAICEDYSSADSEQAPDSRSVRGARGMGGLALNLVWNRENGPLGSFSGCSADSE